MPNVTNKQTQTLSIMSKSSPPTSLEIDQLWLTHRLEAMDGLPVPLSPADILRRKQAKNLPKKPESPYRGETNEAWIARRRRFSSDSISRTVRAFSFDD